MTSMNDPTNPHETTLSADPKNIHSIDDSTLKARAVAGAFWTLGSYGLSQVFRLGSNIILARLLAPEDFGLMALVAVVLQGLGMFSDLGLAPAIIQNKRGDEPVYYNTAWTLQVFRGILLWLGACILAWPASRFYDLPILLYMMPVAGLSALCAGFNSTSLYTMNRHLHMKQLALIDLFSQVLSIVVMIVAASIWPSVWALVAGWIAGSVTKMAMSHILDRRIRNRFTLEREAFFDLFHFGKWIFASTLVTFLALHSDRLVLGKILSSTEFGLYNIALILTFLSLHVANRIMSRVLFPMLSRHQKNLDRMMSMFIKSRRLVLLSGIATCGGIAIAAPGFFKLLYDERYVEAGSIAQWLVIYIWCSLLVSGMSQVQLAMGNSKIMFYSNLIRITGIFLALAGYHFGEIPGFILGMSAGVLLALLYLFARLPSKRMVIMRQSVVYSVILAAYVLLAQALVRVVGAIWSDNVVSIFSLALAGVGCAGIVAALVITLKGRKLPFRSRRIDPGGLSDTDEVV